MCFADSGVENIHATIVSDSVCHPCDNLWLPDFKKSFSTDSALENRFNSVMAIQVNDGLTFSDSVQAFVGDLYSLIQSDSLQKIAYYYLQKIQPYTDGAPSEILTALYFDLYEHDPCEFYQVLAMKKTYFNSDYDDKFLELSYALDFCQHEENARPGYTKWLKKCHLDMYRNNRELQEIVSECFDFLFENME